MAGPLAGVRVLEAGSYVSAPYAGQMLADLGAEVIKVEQPPGGDPFRRFGQPQTRVSPVFANCNRGKKSIAPDLKSVSGLRHLLNLVTGTDVWISNWRPGVADRLGLGDDILQTTNPRLIRVYVTGHGSSGPRASDPVFDTIVQATSGLADALARGDRPELLPGFPVDKATAGMVAQAVLAALYARERHGQGDRIDISMLAAASYTGFIELFANRTFLDHEPAGPRNHHAIGLRPLPASDGWLVLAPVSGRAIRATCEVVGHPEWAPEIRGVEPPERMATELFDRLETVLPAKSTAEWLALLAEEDVPAARCLTMDEHLADAQVTEQGLYRIEPWPDYGPTRVVRYPAEFGFYGRLAATEPPPTVGRDNARLLDRPDG